MDPNGRFLFLHEKTRLTRAAKAEVRAARTAVQQAAIVAARPAGVTSASGGNGGGSGGVSGSTGDAVRQVGAVGAGAAGSPLVFSSHMARRTRPQGRVPRSLDDRDRRPGLEARATSGCCGRVRVSRENC